ncbi:MAG: hypothetical protein KAG98_01290, partial [Lentisphaeria bacterium]|nr:hypothetical protein [Lentisphaeria bacterium]
MKNLSKIRKSILFIGCSLVAVAVTSCQSVDEKKKKPKELKVPDFVADAKAVSASTVPASEKPLIVSDIVPERAQGDDKLELPERIDKKNDHFTQPNFIKELMKGVKDPDKKMNVELDFDAMPLYDVVVGFSDLLGFDFIIDPAVKGSVSIKVASSMKPEDIWSVFES